MFTNKFFNQLTYFVIALLPVVGFANVKENYSATEYLIKELNLNQLYSKTIWQYKCVQRASIIYIDDKVEPECMKKMNEIYQVYEEELHKETKNNLERNFTKDELNELVALFKDPKIKEFYLLYHDVLLKKLKNDLKDNVLASKNREKLIEAIEMNKTNIIDYVKHDHYGMEPHHDTLNAILNKLDDTCCIDSEKYNKEFELANKKEIHEFAMLIAKDFPDFKNFESEAQKIQSISKDTHFMYWEMLKNKSLTENDYKKVLKLLGENSAFNRFTNLVDKTVYELNKLDYKQMQLKEILRDKKKGTDSTGS